MHDQKFVNLSEASHLFIDNRVIVLPACYSDPVALCCLFVSIC